MLEELIFLNNKASYGLIILLTTMLRGAANTHTDTATQIHPKTTARMWTSLAA